MQPRRPRRPRITRFDTSLFANLYKAKRPLSVKKLADRTNMSWQTVNRHVRKLENFGVFRTRKSIRKTNVFIEESWIKDLLRKKGLLK